MWLQCKSTSPHLSHSTFPSSPSFAAAPAISTPSFHLSLLLIYSSSSFLLLLLHFQQQQRNVMGSLNKPTVIDGVDGKVVVVDTPAPTRLRAYHLLLRFLAFALTLIATFIVGVDKETKTITIYAGLRFQATAHWKYMSSFVYFLVANAIACSYGAASLVITEMAARRSSNNGNNNLRVRLAVTTCDLLIMALLFSANGAAAAIGMIGQKGNSHVHWMRVCDEFEAYCRHMTTAVVLSLVGSAAFLALVALSAFILN